MKGGEARPEYKVVGAIITQTTLYLDPIILIMPSSPFVPGIVPGILLAFKTRSPCRYVSSLPILSLLSPYPNRTLRACLQKASPFMHVIPHGMDPDRPRLSSAPCHHPCSHNHEPPPVALCHDHELPTASTVGPKFQHENVIAYRCDGPYLPPCQHWPTW